MVRNRAFLALALLSFLVLANVAVLAQDAKPSDVEVTVQHTDSGWPVSPIWIAVGAVALVAVIALIVAASRGREGVTTVVK